MALVSGAALWLSRDAGQARDALSTERVKTLPGYDDALAGGLQAGARGHVSVAAGSNLVLYARDNVQLGTDTRSNLLVLRKDGNVDVVSSSTVRVTATRNVEITSTESSVSIGTSTVPRQLTVSGSGVAVVGQAMLTSAPTTAATSVSGLRLDAPSASTAFTAHISEANELEFYSMTDTQLATPVRRRLLSIGVGGDANTYPFRLPTSTNPLYI